MAYGSSYHDEIVEYYQYGVKSFFADVGGFLGLFLGVSLLSIYDIIVTTVTYAMKSITKVKSRSSAKGRRTTIYEVRSRAETEAHLKSQTIS